MRFVGQDRCEMRAKGCEAMWKEGRVLAGGGLRARSVDCCEIREDVYESNQRGPAELTYEH
jgi:hypothetical protein